MKCRHRDETPIGQNEVDILLTEMMPKYISIFPNLGDHMAEILQQKNMFEGLINSTLGSATPTTELSEIEELGSFLQALYNILCMYRRSIKENKYIPEIENLNPELYYTESELSSINLYIKDIPKDGDIVEFTVFKCSETHYVCPKIELPQYVSYFNRGLINYNMNTQRETTKTFNKKTNQVDEKITTFPKNIKEMIEDLKNDKFHPNNLILSIRENGHELYDDGDLQVGQIGKLKVQVRDKSHLDINDGMNRTLAFRGYVKQVPNTDKYTGIDIFVCSEKEALEIITQANKGEKIKPESLVQKDISNSGMRIARNLNNKSEMLKGKIATDLIDIIAYNKYTDVLTLGEVVNEVFGEDVQGKPAETFELTKYLSEFYDLIIDYYRDYFSNKLLTNVEFYQRKNLVAIFICIAKHLKDEEDWQIKLFDCLDKISIESILKITPKYKRIKKQHIRTMIRNMENILNNNNENKEVIL